VLLVNTGLKQLFYRAISNRIIDHRGISFSFSSWESQPPSDEDPSLVLLAQNLSRSSAANDFNA
jgi:hypothetical protein